MESDTSMIWQASGSQMPIKSARLALPDPALCHVVPVIQEVNLRLQTCINDQSLYAHR
jgi:hypothetical protein